MLCHYRRYQMFAVRQPHYFLLRLRLRHHLWCLQFQRQNHRYFLAMALLLACCRYQKWMRYAVRHLLSRRFFLLVYWGRHPRHHRHHLMLWLKIWN